MSNTLQVIKSGKLLKLTLESRFGANIFQKDCFKLSDLLNYQISCKNVRVEMDGRSEPQYNVKITTKHNDYCYKNIANAEAVDISLDVILGEQNILPKNDYINDGNGN